MPKANKSMYECWNDDCRWAKFWGQQTVLIRFNMEMWLILDWNYFRVIFGLEMKKKYSCNNTGEYLLEFDHLFLKRTRWMWATTLVLVGLDFLANKEQKPDGTKSIFFSPVNIKVFLKTTLIEDTVLVRAQLHNRRYLANWFLSASWTIKLTD